MIILLGGASNVIFTRNNDYTNGIKVYDSDDNEIGISKKAGMFAILQMTLSRNITSIAALNIAQLIKLL